MIHDKRLEQYDTVSTHLALLSDHQMSALLEQAIPVGVGIGGTTATLNVDGVPVFVKKVPLTDLEHRPEHVHSTANMFDLPTFYQYGVGSAGFGVWRELAVHTMTTNWVLTGAYPGFPLLYHWRILPRQPIPRDSVKLEEIVSYWDDSPAIRARLTAIAEASAEVVLFMEHIPQTVHTWLTERITLGGQVATDASNLIERELAAGTAFMNSRGLLHFDAHFHNLLTDGERVYFADFGLAIHSDFDLTLAEADFFTKHAAYDSCYVRAHLARWLLTTLGNIDLRSPECDARLRACAAGNTDSALPEAAAAIIKRHAPIAVVMGEFLGRLRTESKTIPYPLEKIQGICGE